MTQVFLDDITDPQATIKKILRSGNTQPITTNCFQMYTF